MIEEVKTRARDFEQCREIANVLIKEKRAQRFSTLDLEIISSSGRSRYIRIPLTTVFLLCKNTRLLC